jgi:hypothetical protein
MTGRVPRNDAQKRLQSYGKKVNEKGAKSYKNGQNRNKRMFYIIF